MELFATKVKQLEAVKYSHKDDNLRRGKIPGIAYRQI